MSEAVCTLGWVTIVGVQEEKDGVFPCHSEHALVIARLYELLIFLITKGFYNVVYLPRSWRTRVTQRLVSFIKHLPIYISRMMKVWRQAMSVRQERIQFYIVEPRMSYRYEKNEW